MRRTWRLVASMAGIAALIASPAFALVEPSTGTRFDSTAEVDDTEFECVGTGVRKVLTAKVYAAAFCLETGVQEALVSEYVAQAHPNLEGEELATALQDDENFYELLTMVPAGKLVVLKMVRDVSKQQLADAFTKSLSKVLSKNKVATLVSAIPGDARAGESALIYTEGPDLVIDIGGRQRRVQDEEIASKIWAVWLGKDSVTPALKRSVARNIADGEETSG